MPVHERQQNSPWGVRRKTAKIILFHAVRQISLAATLTLQARWQELGSHVGGLNRPVTCVILKRASTRQRHTR